MDKQRERWAAEKAFEDRIRAHVRAEQKPKASPIAIVATVLVVAFLLFLSSCDARSASHDVVAGSSQHTAGLLCCGLSSGLHGALDLRRVSKDEWTAPKPPLLWLYVWPSLPSIEEVRIKIAKVRIVNEFQKQEEARKAAELALDWEALRKALGLAFICVGAGVTLIYGCVRHPNSRNRV